MKELKELLQALKSLDFARANELIEKLSLSESLPENVSSKELPLLWELKIYLKTSKELADIIFSSLSGELLREGHGSCFVNTRA